MVRKKEIWRRRLKTNMTTMTMKTIYSKLALSRSERKVQAWTANGICRISLAFDEISGVLSLINSEIKHFTNISNCMLVIVYSCCNEAQHSWLFLVPQGSSELPQPWSCKHSPRKPGLTTCSIAEGCLKNSVMTMSAWSQEELCL